MAIVASSTSASEAPESSEVGWSRISDASSNKIANLGFVCALLVVFVHVECRPHVIGSSAWIVWFFLRYVMATMAVPYFFVVSGFFLARHCENAGWWKSAVQKRVKSLLVPLFFWCALMLVFIKFLLPVGDFFITGASGWKPVSAIEVVNALGLNPFRSPILSPMWYVRTLFVFVLVSPLVVKAVKKWGLLLLALLFVLHLAICAGPLAGDGFWIPREARSFFQGYLSLEGLFYFSVGIFICLKRVCPLSGSLWCGLGLLGFAMGCGEIALQMAGLGDHGYLIALSRPCLLVFFWGIISTRRTAKWLTGSAFPIYASHMFFLVLFWRLSRFIPEASREGFWEMFAEWSFAVCGAILMTVLVRRILPRVGTLIFGGR